jgi:hypothetical protein
VFGWLKLLSQGDLASALALVDLSIRAAVAGVIAASTPLCLLEDIFDAALVSVCEEAFAFVEARRDVWLAVRVLVCVLVVGFFLVFFGCCCFSSPRS